MQNIKKRTFWLLAIIGLLFTITACGKSNNDNFGEMKIEFANNSYEYVVGETFKLNPSIQNGTAEDSELVWSIFDESVVKLVNGEFVALKEGKTVVKVASATKPNVNAMTSIKVVKNQYFPVVSFDTVLDTMNVDDTQMIRATIEGADFEAKVTYRSLDNNVASVNELGVVEAFNAGATVIIVRVEEVGDASNYEEYPFLIQVVEPEYAIDYVLNGGKNHLENLDYYTKRQCPVVLKEPTRDGYKFLGWYDLEGNQVTEISKYEEADVTLEAKWEIVEYSANFTLVDFVIENLSTDGDEILLCEDVYDTPTEWWSFIGINKTEKENLFEIMATGYKWDGIANSYDYYIAIHGDYRFESDEKYDTYYRLMSLLMDNANAVGKYVYIDMSTNTDMNAAIYEEMDTYTINEYVNPFVTPVRVGHDFLGWYSVDENGVESSEPVTAIDRGSKGDLTFIANWTPSRYVVKYNLNGGEGVAKDYYTFIYSDAKGDDYVLQTPTKTGYTFEGWYKEADFSGEKVTEIAKGTLGDQEFYAKWTLDTYTITYDTNGGLALGTNPTEYTAETPTIQLFACEKMYYNFVGWEDQDGNVIDDIKQGSAGNLVLTAKYTPCEYEIVYKLNGGEGEETGKYSYNETEAYVLQVPTREDYNFLGWYDNADFNGDPITVIAKGSTGDLSLYAKWESAYKNIEYELNGGEWNVIDLSSATAVQTFTLTRYLGYDSNGYQASLHNAKPATWWYYIAIVETAQSGVYEIKQIVSKNSNVTVAYDYVIMWHSSLSQDCKTALNAMYNSASDYVGDYIVFENLPDASSSSANITVKVYNANDAVVSESPVFQYKEGVGASLVDPVKDGATFAGWYDNSSFEGTKLTKISTDQLGDVKLYAKWETNPYKVTLNTNGGIYTTVLNDPTLDDFAEMIVYDFNNTGNSDATATTTRESFKSTSHPNIKYVWNNETNLAKYKWFFEFALEEIKAAALANGMTSDTNYTSTVEMLERMIAGDTTAIGGSYADARTLFRFWIEGLLNEKLPSASIYQKAMVDYSLEANLNRFLNAYQSQTIERTMFGSDDLPTPAKDGYVFLGWYDASDNLVTELTSDCVLTAKYEEAKILIGNIGYATINDAISAASAGATITLKAGTYTESVTINKAISIVGPDAELVLSHNSSYSIDSAKSAVISGAISISSGVKDVKLDGLVIKNSITLNSNENVTIENTVLNYNGSIEGNIAIPSGTTSKNLVVNNVYLYGNSCARTVYVKGTLENLTVTNCATLDGYSGLYDFVRFSAGTEATAKGTITFSNNYIADALEAAFMDRAPKTAKYVIENNYFVNIPATIYFRSYASVSTAQYSIKYNTFIECGDNADDWDVIAVTTGSSTVANVNYNVFIDCLTTAGAKTDYIIKIRTNAGTIDCSNNYSNNNFVDSASKTLLLNATNYSALDVSGTKYTSQTYENYTVCVIDEKVYVYGLNLFSE